LFIGSRPGIAAALRGFQMQRLAFTEPEPANAHEIELSPNPAAVRSTDGARRNGM
jgi:hypothetical protein